MVAWDVDETNWRQGGVTSVSLRIEKLVEPSDSVTTISIISASCIAWSASILPNTIGSPTRGWPSLRGLDFLTELNLARSGPIPVRQVPQDHSVPLTDACLVHLQALPRLENLTLAGNLITDHGLAQIATMTKLKSLDLERHRGQRRRVWSTSRG